MGKLIGYARVSTRAQDTDRQIADLLAAGVRRDDLYVDHGVSGAHARRPQFDKALEAVHADDTLFVTTLDRLGRSTSNMLALADELRAQKGRVVPEQARLLAFSSRRHSNYPGLLVSSTASTCRAASR